MSSQLAFVIAGFLIGVAIIFAQLVPHYQIAAVHDASGRAVWRVNTMTGNLELCTLSPHMVAERAARGYDLVCSTSPGN
jgi:hypothetical protein